LNNSMQAVILAAGRGARLHPYTLKRSKAMLPVAGKPLIARVIEMLASEGVKEFILVAHPQDNELAGFSEQPPPGLRITIVHQPERLGTADALERAAPLVRGDFFLSACDNLVPAGHIAGLRAAWECWPRPNSVLSLMPVTPEKASSTGVVALDGEWVTRIIEKPIPGEAPLNHGHDQPVASLPLYLFSPALLDYLPEVKISRRGEREVQDAIQMLIERHGKVRGVFTANRMTVTTAEDLLALILHYLTTEAGLAQAETRYAVGSGTQIHPPVMVEPGVHIGTGCIIGPNVYIESGCEVGDGSILRNALLLRGVIIPERTTLFSQVVAGSA
jgi:NDP-sugar pyrophosphorylase family protein